VNSFVLKFLVVTVAGFIHRKQQDVIEYLRDENRVLRTARTARREAPPAHRRPTSKTGSSGRSARASRAERSSVHCDPRTRCLPGTANWWRPSTTEPPGEAWGDL
jgi:hypothetical protein